VSDAPSAPVSAPTSTPAAAQPSAVARAVVDENKGDNTLSTREAANFLKQKRAERLKLVPKDEPQADDADAEINPEVNAEAAEIAEDVDADADSEKPPAVEPTWAQKLRTDLGKKTERVQVLEKQHAEREAKFEEAHRAVSSRMEDLSADVAAEQTYSKMLEQAIDSAGFAVPSDWKRAVAAERRTAALERQLARGQTAARQVDHSKVATQAVEQLTGLRKQIPELDGGFTGKDPEAKAWLQERFALDENGKPAGLGMKNLERDAIAFAKALRWDRHSKAQSTKRAPSTPPPSESNRPSSTTLSGGGAGAGGKRSAMVPQNEKDSLQWFAARRAARK